MFKYLFFKSELNRGPKKERCWDCVQLVNYKNKQEHKSVNVFFQFQKQFNSPPTSHLLQLF